MLYENTCMEQLIDHPKDPSLEVLLADSGSFRSSNSALNVPYGSLVALGGKRFFTQPSRSNSCSWILIFSNCSCNLRLFRSRTPPIAFWLDVPPPAALDPAAAVDCSGGGLPRSRFTRFTEVAVGGGVDVKALAFFWTAGCQGSVS